MVNTEDIFNREYQQLVDKVLNDRKVTFPKIMHEKPKMDLAVRVMFDEDLTLMVFPRVHEFECRVS